MDQKNTIVKCKAHPNCLFNHNGVCDNYVINIGENSRCQSYVETEDERVLMCEHCDYYNDNGLLQNPCDKRECYMHRKENACVNFKVKRGLRAKDNIIDDSCDIDIDEDIQLKEAIKRMLYPVTLKVAEFDKPNKNKSVLKLKEDKECYWCEYSIDGICKFSIIPMIDPDGKCCRFSRR